MSNALLPSAFFFTFYWFFTHRLTGSFEVSSVARV